MFILIYEDQKESARLSSAIQAISEKLNHVRKPQFIAKLKSDKEDLQVQYDCLKMQLNDSFVSDLIKELLARIGDYETSIAECLQKISSNPGWGIKARGSELIHNYRTKLLHSQLLDEVIKHKNESHVHWIVWLNDVMENWNKELTDELIQRSSHIHCSSSAFENVVAMCEVEAYARFCDDLFFKCAMEEVRRGIIWAKNNNPDSLFIWFDVPQTSTECTFAPMPALPVERLDQPTTRSPAREGA